MQDAALTVRSHYNARPNQTPNARSHSPSIRIKKLNNWIKAALINSTAPRGAVVLDLCCGKGGDLAKWQGVGVRHLVCAGELLSPLGKS
jgi:mRNA (guanine-N7-)-methyltransferase